MNIKFSNLQKITDFCQKNDISHLSLFGSYARGEERKDSDIDLLVKFSTAKSYFELVRIERELTNIFGKKVDLVTEAALSKYIKPIVNNQIINIYERKN